jgi:hypothetical protein
LAPEAKVKSYERPWDWVHLVERVPEAPEFSYRQMTVPDVLEFRLARGLPDRVEDDLEYWPVVRQASGIVVGFRAMLESGTEV